MQSILVAVDGSAHALKGVGVAAELARSLPATLELVYVVPPILLAPSVYSETIAKLEESNRLLAEEVLSAAKKAVAIDGVKVDTVVANGAPAEALADLAQADRIWGVVIGARGHSAVARVLLGSVTDRLVHICPKPVLVVR